jgi:Domain of unknown function (DUF1844)
MLNITVAFQGSPPSLTTYEMEESGQSKKAPTVYDHLAMILDQMAGVSWQKLGLQTDMVTGQIEKDLTQARIAIDVVSFVSRILEEQVDDEDKRQLQTLVRDLKINYVQQQGGQS